jgi:HPt (histidine-containing phosphotransfer) domain-containing protein
MMSRVSTTHSVQGAVDPTAAGSAGATLASAAGVLDAQALERLRELDPTGQNKLLERVFKAFEQSIGRLMPQLDAARADADWQAVRHVAHTLKSSSASIGAVKLSQLCADIETMVRQSQVEGLSERLDAMGAEVARVLAALRGLQGGGQP